MKKIIFLVLCLCSSSFALAQTYSDAQKAQSKWRDQSIWSNPDRSYFWYGSKKNEEEAASAPEASAQAAKPPKPPVDATPAEVGQMKKLQDEVDLLKTVAVMNPTPRNVQKYIEKQQAVFDLSTRFTDVWQKVVAANPQLDNTFTGRPVSPQALTVYEDTQRDNQLSDLKTVGNNYGIYFFFRSDCPYCHAFSPIVKQFSEKYSITVFPVSTDGRGIQEFPNPTPDSGVGRTLGVSAVPSVFLASPQTGDVIPLGAGLMSFSELEKRVAQATATTKISTR